MVSREQIEAHTAAEPEETAVAMPASTAAGVTVLAGLAATTYAILSNVVVLQVVVLLALIPLAVHHQPGRAPPGAIARWMLVPASAIVTLTSPWRPSKRGKLYRLVHRPFERR